MRTSRSILGVTMFPLLLAACGDAAFEPLPSGGTDTSTLCTAARTLAGESGCGIWDPQGPDLLRAQERLNDPSSFYVQTAVRLPSLGHVTVHLEEHDGFQVSDGQPPTGLRFDGSSQVDNEPLQFRIDDSSGVDADGHALFQVSVRWIGAGSLGESAPWEPFCRDNSPAQVLPGYFDGLGRFNSSKTQQVSVTCTGGAATKALRWQYSPWTRTPFFQAASRMARADYCGDSRAHTMIGTIIKFSDPLDYFLGAHTDPSLLVTPSDYRFEAAWSKDPNKGAFCIARWRWNALAPDECETTKDPRFAPNPAKVIPICEELAAAGATTPMTEHEMLVQLGAHGAGTFSYVRENDVGVWRWRDAATGNFLSTTAGFNGGPSRPDLTHTPDAYHTEPSPTFVADLFEQDRGGMETVSIYRYNDHDTIDSNDLFRTTRVKLETVDPGNWVLVNYKIGWIKPSAPIQADYDNAPFRHVWKHLQTYKVPGTNRFALVASPVGATPTPPAGYTELVNEEGYTL
jgi:hypothetical protein